MQHLRVASFNIRLGLEHGLQQIAATISALQPDLIALQEIGDHWSMGESIDQLASLSIASNLPHQHMLQTLHTPSGGAFGHAILSRYPLKNIREHPLPQRHDEARALLSFRCCPPRCTPIYVFSTHLSHLANERTLQHPILRNITSKVPRQHPMLILGDLNEPLPDQLQKLLQTTSLQDLGAPEYHPTFPAKNPTQRLDVILTRGLPIETTLQVSADLSSDHRPIYATLQLKEET